MVVADDAMTRALAIVGAVSGLIGVGIALVAYLRDRPQLIVRSGTGETVFRSQPRERSGRVFLANHGRQPITIVEAGLTTVRNVSWTRRAVAWGGFLAVSPIWIAIYAAARLSDAAQNQIRHARTRAPRYGPLASPSHSKLPAKLDIRVRLGLFDQGPAWLAPDLEKEPLLLPPGQARSLVLPWPDIPGWPRQRIFAFATDSRGRKVIDTRNASPWR
jgi:hypothetical protein